MAAACLVTALPASKALGQSRDSRLAQATREHLQERLAEAEKIVASPGYSGRIKSIKRKEITLLKSRLEDGDLQPGDQVALQVAGDSLLTGTFVVTPNRVLPLPGLGDIPVKGVLRTEVPGYLTTELKKYLKNPTVTAQTTMRLSFLGAVGRPGYYQMPAEILVDSAIMAAGGPSGGTDPAKTKVERSGVEVLSPEGFRQAVIEGRTLDQLNLRAGDEIIVGGERTPGVRRGIMAVLPYLGAAASFGFLVTRLFRL